MSFENMPLISIIVPVYKAEVTLSKCVNSIIGQSYRNLEIILVDDGSPDACGAICDQYAMSDERVRVIHQANYGLSAARNAALDIMQGAFVGFVDSDDYIDGDMISNLYRTMQENDAQISVCGFCKFFDDGKKTTENPFSETVVMEHDEAMTMFLPDERIGSQPCNKLFCAELFSDVRFPIGRVYEDLAIMHLVFNRASRVACVPECYYHYFIHESSISFTQNARWAYGLYRAFADRVVFMRENGYGGQIFDICLVKACRFAISGLRQWNRKSEDEFAYITDARAFLRDVRKYAMKCKKMPAKMKMKMLIAIYAYGLMRG